MNNNIKKNYCSMFHMYLLRCKKKGCPQITTIIVIITMRLIRAGLIKDHEVLIVRNRQEKSKVKKKEGNMRLRPCLHREGTKEGKSYNEKKKEQREPRRI